MDSTFISSNIKRSGRLVLGMDVLEQAVKAIPESLRSDSLSKVLENNFRSDLLYRSKSNQSKEKLGFIINLCLEVLNIADKNSGLMSKDKIKILKRFVEEQTVFDTETSTYRIKEGKEISSNSLQSAYDTDATYRKKGNRKSVGYSLNVTETCSNENKVQLITDYKLDVNITSDVAMIKERLPIVCNHIECKDLYVDGGYYLKENDKQSLPQNVNIHFTDMTGKKVKNKKIPYTKFAIEEDYTVTSCPMSNVPIDSKFKSKNKVIIAHFKHEYCEQCKLIDTCPIKRQKKSYVFRVELEAIENQKKREEIKTNRKENTSKRAAIESTNSELKRQHGIDHSRVRGLNKINMAAGLKITACNIKRMAKYIINKSRDIGKSGIPNLQGVVCPIADK